MYRSRRKRLPPLPETRAETDTICFVILRRYKHSRSAPWPAVSSGLCLATIQDIQQMFTYLKKELQNRGLQMSPQSVMANFELAVIQSLEMRLPGVEIQGCYFHFSQCLWRKVQALRMADLYKNDADTRNFIHKAAALPPRFIRIAWTLVESEAPQTSEADEFIQYFKSTWLKAGIIT